VDSISRLKRFNPIWTRLFWKFYLQGRYDKRSKKSCKKKQCLSWLPNDVIILTRICINIMLLWRISLLNRMILLMFWAIC